MNPHACLFPDCDWPVAEGHMCERHKKVRVARNGSWVADHKHDDAGSDDQ